MKELIVRLSGAVSESNFKQFEAAWIEKIRSANKTLKTDEDFAEAEILVKSFKEAEDIIDAARTQALSQTADIRTLFETMTKLSDELTETRLSLTKQIKTEKDRRKDEIVQDGIALVSSYLADKAIPEIPMLYTSNRATFTEVVKGKKTVKSMKQAVDDLVAAEKEKIDAAADLITANRTILDAAMADNAPLFPDSKNLICKPSAELQVTIESRVAKFELAEKERKEREAKAKAQAEAKAKLKADEKTAAEKKAAEQAPAPEKPARESASIAGPHYASIPPPKQAAAPITKEPVPPPDQQEVTDFILSVLIRGIKDQAVTVSREIEGVIGGRPEVIKLSLKLASDVQQS